MWELIVKPNTHSPKLPLKELKERGEQFYYSDLELVCKLYIVLTLLFLLSILLFLYFSAVLLQPSHKQPT